MGRLDDGLGKLERNWGPELTTLVGGLRDQRGRLKRQEVGTLDGGGCTIGGGWSHRERLGNGGVDSLDRGHAS